ncbi:hypothetical protein LWM68_14710 [Niabella sp. W65]|nr:hypothetical protein [Niabella sp. W65]MCH7363894.1 hypothetical protein [Niabella sp. W65]ULT39793.1 hypothetical protein KRR40_33530 [Niabella sp. I65]
MIKRCTILLTLLIVSFTGRTQLPDLPWAKEVGAKKFPSAKKIYYANNYGAKSDTLTINTRAIQKLLTPAPKPAAAL